MAEVKIENLIGRQFIVIAADKHTMLVQDVSDGFGGVANDPLYKIYSVPDGTGDSVLYAAELKVK